MNSYQLLLSVALLVACVVAIQGTDSIIDLPSFSGNVNAQPQKYDKTEEPQDIRNKRFVPILASAHTYKYTYVGAYPNAVSGVRYLHPIAAAYHPIARIIY